jgi:hypothetical protein
MSIQGGWPGRLQELDGEIKYFCIGLYYFAGSLWNFVGID